VTDTRCSPWGRAPDQRLRSCSSRGGLGLEPQPQHAGHNAVRFDDLGPAAIVGTRGLEGVSVLIVVGVANHQYWPPTVLD
jgi:hypothetical protein